MTGPHDTIRAHLLRPLGPLDWAPPAPVPLPVQWSERFEQAMRARLAIGALRYGALGHSVTDGIPLALARLAEYRETGNSELLVDVAALCLVEFAAPLNPRAHWAPKDRDE